VDADAFRRRPSNPFGKRRALDGVDELPKRENGTCAFRLWNVWSISSGRLEGFATQDET
jgi:hypothetical protein